MSKILIFMIPTTGKSTKQITREAWEAVEQYKASQKDQTNSKDRKELKVPNTKK